MMRMLETAWRSPAVLMAIVVLAALLAYVPGLRGPFVFDDTVHIADNPSIALARLDLTSLEEALMSNQTDLSGRPLAMLSFALNASLAGSTSQALPFKITNLCIHLLNAVLVYWLCVLLARRLVDIDHAGWGRWFPALVAASWALHPLQLTNVLYVVQRMNSLAATFVLGGLIVFCYGRHAVQAGRPRGYALMVGGLLGGVTLGLTSKENAALLPLFALVIEYTLFRLRSLAPRERRRLWLFYAAFVALPVVLALSWIVVHPELVSRSYSMREFGLYERLLTEARILWFYVSLLLLPAPGRFSLFHDDLPLSTGLIDPWTTLPAVLALAAVVFFALLARRRSPLFSFAVLWFLAGHAMESGIIGLEIAHEHRNYLPSLGVLFGCAYAFVWGLTRLRISIPVRIGLVLLLPVALALGTHARAQAWSTQEGIANHLVAHHPLSARAHALLAESYAQRNNAIGALQHYRRAASLAPSETSYLLRLALTTARSELASASGERLVPGTPLGNLRLPSGIALDHSASRVRLRLTADTKDEIAKALKLNPVHARTAQVLNELADCALIDPDSCTYLYRDIVQWHELAAHNPRSLSSSRHDILISVTRLCLQHGDHSCALENAQYARRTAPENLNFILMEADVYYRLDRLDESERALRALESPPAPLTPNIRRQADMLAALIQARRRARTD